MEVIKESSCCCCLNIGIDIDDTICDFGSEFIKFYNKLHQTNHSLFYMRECDYASFLKISPVYCNELLTKFTIEYIHKLLPFKGSFDALTKLKLQFNCKLYIITYRSERFKIQTIEWIDKHFPGIFSGIEFGNFYDSNDYKKRTKKEMCLSLNINILIDDRYDVISHCRTIPGFLGIIYERPWSMDKHKLTGQYSFYSWSMFSLRTILREIILNKIKCYNKDIIIGLSGKFGSGKDTACDFIIHEFPNFGQYAFAYRLKEVVSLLTNSSINDTLSQEGKAIIPQGFDKSIGQLLQIVGEGLCEIISPELWVNCVLENPKRENTIVLSDTRKKIEANAIMKRDGLLIRINGDPADIRKINKAKRDLNHRSEIELDDYPFDYIIENNGTKEELNNKILFIIYPYLFNKLFCCYTVTFHFLGNRVFLWWFFT